MLRSERRLLIGAWVGGVLAFGGLAGFAVWNARAVRTSIELAEHTHQVLLSIERLRHLRFQSNFEGRQAAGTGLPPLRSERDDHQVMLNKERAELFYLQGLVSDNTQQLVAARELADLTELQLRLQYARLNEPASAGGAALDNASLRGLRARVRNKAHELSETERTLLLVRQEQLEREIEGASWSAFAGALCSLFIFLGLPWVLNRKVDTSVRLAGAPLRRENGPAATLDSIGDAEICANHEDETSHRV